MQKCFVVVACFASMLMGCVLEPEGQMALDDEVESVQQEALVGESDLLGYKNGYATSMSPSNITIEEGNSWRFYNQSGQSSVKFKLVTDPCTGTCGVKIIDVLDYDDVYFNHTTGGKTKAVIGADGITIGYIHILDN